MKKSTKFITTILLTLSLMMCVSVAAFADTPGKSVKVTIPTFNVTMNQQLVDNAYRQYPFIVYKDITYFPMTYWDMRFLGLENTWSQEEGTSITTTGKAGEYKPTMQNTTNAKTNNAVVSAGKYVVNGISVDNSKEEYPILSFRDVSYFPLTWNWCQQFGWNSSFDMTNGLIINTDGATINKPKPIENTVQTQPSSNSSASELPGVDTVLLKRGDKIRIHLRGQVIEKWEACCSDIIITDYDNDSVEVYAKSNARAIHHYVEATAKPGPNERVGKVYMRIIQIF